MGLTLLSSVVPGVSTRMTGACAICHPRACPEDPARSSARRGAGRRGAQRCHNACLLRRKLISWVLGSMPEACFQHAPEDDTELSTFSPRGIAARGFEKKGSAGAKALRSCCNKRAALQRPRRLLPCRGCGHIVSGLVGPALAPSGEPLASEDLELLRASLKERRCATGVRAVCCHACTASIRGPGIRGELNLASDAATVRSSASAGSPPPPRKAAQLMRPMWTGVRGV